ncbi:TolC family protein [Sulfurimonas sp.]
MKRLLLVPFIVWNLQAQDFNTFLQNALQTSPYLKANALEIERAKSEASLIQRYKNPTLSLEASEFSPDVGNNKAGYRGALTQPLRLWGIGDDREKLGEATQNRAKSLVTLQRAEFVKTLALLYIRYTKQNASVELGEEALNIAQNIAKISKERYEAGTIARVKYLQAKVDALSAKNRLDAKKADMFSSYYTLLAFAGQKEEVMLESDYKFVLAKKNNLEDSAQLNFMKSTQKSLEREAALHSNKIEWMNVYAEYEKEPDQSIARVGINIPLAVFNTKKEEKHIAQLQAKQSKYLIQNQKTALSYKLTQLQKELQILHGVLHSTKELYVSQKELLLMYEDGYKIANIKLIELQNIKNQMIQTKEKEIQLQNKINSDIVLYNYATGEYNE